MVPSNLPSKRQVRFLVLRAGTYRWSRIDLPAPGLNSWYSWELDEGDGHWRFQVEPGRINYPGVLNLERKGRDRLLHFTLNRTGQLIEFLREEAGFLFEDYPMAYTGRVRDDFLAFYSSQFVRTSRSEEGRPEPGSDER